MYIRPLADRVVIKQLTTESEVKSGDIIIPDSVKEKPQEGEVLETGPGRTESGVLVKMEVRKGDRVFYGKYAGTEVNLGGEDVIIMREADILAILSRPQVETLQDKRKPYRTPVVPPAPPPGPAPRRIKENKQPERFPTPPRERSEPTPEDPLENGPRY